MQTEEQILREKIHQLKTIFKRGIVKKEAKEFKEAVEEFQIIIADNFTSKNEEWIKIKEDSIYELASLFAKLKLRDQLIHLNQVVRPFFHFFPKAKTAKIVRTIIEQFDYIPDSIDIQVKICEESIHWANEEKRSFLRQRLEARLSSLYFDKEEYSKALKVLDPLVTEVKRLDDKSLLVEVQLLESLIQHALRNIAKAKGALTSARTTANSVYCPILLQADMDHHSGVLNVEEKDYKTAYSYFYEAFEGYHSLNHPKAIKSLKYMLMTKILANMPEDVNAVLTAKSAQKYSGDELNSMRDVAAAYQERSLHDFEKTIEKYQTELVKDALVKLHLGELYEKLFEQHLLRIIEPFSRVEIDHIAKLLRLSKDKVESKLSQLILDKKLNGTLDQGRVRGQTVDVDCLIIHEQGKDLVGKGTVASGVDPLYTAAIGTTKELNLALDAIFERAQELATSK